MYRGVVCLCANQDSSVHIAQIIQAGTDQWLLSWNRRHHYDPHAETPYHSIHSTEKLSVRFLLVRAKPCWTEVGIEKMCLRLKNAFVCCSWGWHCTSVSFDFLPKPWSLHSVHSPSPPVCPYPITSSCIWILSHFSQNLCWEINETLGRYCSELSPCVIESTKWDQALKVGAGLWDKLGLGITACMECCWL